MNLVLLELSDFIDFETVQIKGRRLAHLLSVNKIKENDTLICGLRNGKIGTGIVTEKSESLIVMNVRLTEDPPEPLPLTLILALPRPKMLKRIIETVTTLGVKNIYLINSWRVEKGFWQSPLLSPESLDQFIIPGLEQGRDTLMPKIFQKRFFNDFVNDELSDISKDSVRITAHPKTSRLCPAGINQPVILVIGPEGGFIDIEIKSLENQGFLTCHIGKRILKVETAVTFLISRLFL